MLFSTAHPDLGFPSTHSKLHYMSQGMYVGLKTSMLDVVIYLNQFVELTCKGFD